MIDPFLSYENVELEYVTGAGPVRALDGLDLAVPKGELVCVRGRSGSGKSSLIHVSAALRMPTGGSVRIGEVNIGDLTQAQAAVYRRRRCGVVFQFFNLLPMLSIFENVAFPLLLDGIPLARIRPIAESLLEELGLGGMEERRPDTLSGGEMQRVAIARALAIEPDVLLADEPTGSLDSATASSVWASLRDVTRRRGITTVIVTHDPDGTTYADRVITLADGRVAEDTAAERAR